MQQQTSTKFDNERKLKASSSLPFISKPNIHIPTLEFMATKSPKQTESGFHSPSNQLMSYTSDLANMSKRLEKNIIYEALSTKNTDRDRDKDKEPKKRAIFFPKEKPRFSSYIDNKKIAFTNGNLNTNTNSNNITNDMSTYETYNNNIQDILESISAKNDNHIHPHPHPHYHHSQSQSQSQNLHHNNNNNNKLFKSKTRYESQRSSIGDQYKLNHIDTDRQSIPSNQYITSRETLITDIKMITNNTNSPQNKALMTATNENDLSNFILDNLIKVKRNNNNSRDIDNDNDNDDDDNNEYDNKNNNGNGGGGDINKFKTNNYLTYSGGKTNYDHLKKNKNGVNNKFFCMTTRDSYAGGINRIGHGDAAGNNDNGDIYDYEHVIKGNKSKNKANRFQIAMAKKCIKSSGFPLRVFINLLKNTRLYYQLIEDAFEKNNQKYRSGNNTQRTSTPNGNMNHLEGNFESLLIEVMDYIENNQKRYVDDMNLMNNNNNKKKQDHQQHMNQNIRSNNLFQYDQEHNSDNLRHTLQINLDLKEKEKPPHELLYCNIQNVINLIDNIIQNRRKYGIIDAQMKKITNIGQSSGNIEFQLGCLKLVGRILFQKKDYQGAITILKQYKNIAHAFGDNVNRLKAYKHLGKCYQAMQKYRVARIYYTKLLQLAWHSNNKDYEILAYDLIGMQYYYIGELEKAQYYHEKMMKGVVEDNKGIKLLGIQKMQNSHIHSNNSPTNNKTNDNDIITSSSIKLSKSQNNQQQPQSEYNNNQLYHRQYQTQNPQSINNNVRIEDGIEISSGDELELPMPDYNMSKKDKGKERLEYDKINNKKDLNNLKRREYFRNKNQKANSSKMHFSHVKQNGYFNNNDHSNNKTLIRKNDFLSKFNIVHGQPPLQERIFINHLSRNRGLENFNENMQTNLGYIMENIPIDNQIDAFTAEKIKKLLEKYKSNLAIIKNGIEVFFQVKNTFMVDSLIDKKIKAMNAI